MDFGLWISREDLGGFRVEDSLLQVEDFLLRVEDS